MIPKLTHAEACELVEKVLGRVADTLAYIRKKLEKNDGIPLSLFDYDTTEEANLLCNINWYGAYLHGVKSTINLLREYGLLNIPLPKGVGKVKDAPIYNKAVIDLIMTDSVSMDRFLSRDFDHIQYTDHERDKKGKLIKCRAYFAKRVTTCVEIKD